MVISHERHMLCVLLREKGETISTMKVSVGVTRCTLFTLSHIRCDAENARTRGLMQLTAEWVYQVAATRKDLVDAARILDLLMPIG